MLNGENMKLNNKGFTLIELLGVLVVLIAVLLVAIPSIASTFERNKKRIDEQKKEVIISAGEIYASRYKKEFNYNNFLNGSCCISLKSIKNKDLITEEELKGSNGNNLFSNIETVFVCYYKDNGKYEIEENKLAC